MNEWSMYLKLHFKWPKSNCFTKQKQEHNSSHHQRQYKCLCPLMSWHSRSHGLRTSRALLAVKSFTLPSFTKTISDHNKNALTFSLLSSSCATNFEAWPWWISTWPNKFVSISWYSPFFYTDVFLSSIHIFPHLVFIIAL